MEWKQNNITQAPAPSKFLDRSMQDIEYSIMKVINNEMTHKYSWKCYRTDLTLVAWLTSLTLYTVLWIVFKIKKILLLLLELNSKNVKSFLVYQCLST